MCITQQPESCHSFVCKVRDACDEGVNYRAEGLIMCKMYSCADGMCYVTHTHTCQLVGTRENLTIERESHLATLLEPGPQALLNAIKQVLVVSKDQELVI